MTFSRKILSLLTSLFFVASTTLIFAIPGSSAIRAADTTITDVGERAFNDLRRCVNTKKVINAFYLVDESSSLQSSDGDNLRAQILANSLEELFGLSRGVVVNYAVGFFGTDYETWRSWTTITKSNIKSEKSSLINEVSSRNQGAWTNWQKGIDGAREELEIQSSKTDGCQTLIWLTDGKLDIEGDEQKNNIAYDELCSSTMELLRQSGVSVLGVLLQNEKYLDRLTDKAKKETLVEMSKMKPLVEGTGNVGGQNQTCGTFPIPDNYTAGGLVVAVDPIGLAFQFAVIAEQIDCGVTEPLPSGPNQSFLVEPGISKVTIITTSNDWSIENPDGISVNPPSTTTAGVTKISLEIGNGETGNWVLNTKAASSSQIVFCNELGIELDETTLVAGVPGVISGTIVSNLDRPVDLGVYKSYVLIIQEIYNDGSSSSAQSVEVNNQNQFSLREFRPKEGQSQIQVRVTLKTTTKSGRELAEVSVTRILDVKLPEEYPRLKDNPVTLSELKGSREPAAGTLTFIGSSTSDGTVCFAAKPKVLQDVVDRKPSWQWSINGSEKFECVDVPKGDEVSVSISATNSVTGDSKVLAAIPIEITAVGSPSIPLEAVVTFKSSKITLPLWAKILLFILIALIALLIPILLIYLVRVATTKLLISDPANPLARTALSVLITPEGLKAEDGSALTLPNNSFVLMSTKGSVLSYQDQTLGEVKPRVPFWFLSREWFDVTAPAGYRIVNLYRSGAGSNSRFINGQIAEVDPNFGKFWAVLVSEQKLRSLSESATSLEGTLVAFMRPRVDVQNQGQSIINEIALKREIWVRAKDIAKNLNAVTEQKPLVKKPENIAKQSPVVQPGVGAPPPPPAGGGAPPPPPPPPPPAGGGAPPPPPPPPR